MLGQLRAGNIDKALASLTEDAGERFRSVRIEDTGCGMDEAFIRDRLFSPFDSTKGVTGMGIGAYQSRQYLRSIGGDLRVTSVPGEGSCFVLTLPAPTASNQLAGSVRT